MSDLRNFGTGSNRRIYTLNMNTPKLKTIKNGYFVPRGIISRHDLVYDHEGILIIDSCTLRGKSLTENASNPPDHINKQQMEDAGISNESVLFLGNFMNPHFGHLITEGISRLWYAISDDGKQYRMACGSNPFGIRQSIKRVIKPTELHWQKVIRCLNIHENNFLPVKRPTRFDTIRIPESTWLERNRTLPAHLLVTQKAAKCLTKDMDLEPDSTPVYFSRTRLKTANLRYKNEEKVEKFCRDHGWKIIYPERLSLNEQAALVNRHRIFAGCIGSAFHTLLFRYVDRDFRCIYLGMNKSYPNYELMDHLIGCKSTYIPCISREGGDAVTRIIDFESAITSLS